MDVAVHQHAAATQPVDVHEPAILPPSRRSRRRSRGRGRPTPPAARQRSSRSRRRRRGRMPAPAQGPRRSQPSDRGAGSPRPRSLGGLSSFSGMTEGVDCARDRGRLARRGCDLGEGIATGNATFETEPPSWAAFDATRKTEGRFVAEDSGAVVGWAALSPVSSRPCYAGVAENSVYVASAARGRGVGTALMDALTAAALPRGYGRSRRACSRRMPPASRSTSGRVPRRRPARAHRRARRRVARHAVSRAAASLSRAA